MKTMRSSKPVAIWLLFGVFMLVIQIALGGITRLTGSGLSITEWEVITGAIPPLNEQEWLLEFEKYQQTPQYRLLNVDFSLADFKSIYFWEWLHRLWGRIMGVVFLVGLVVFWMQQRLTSVMIQPFIILFLLGALQGAVGWIMVASGLTGDAVYVKPTRLALHFIFAMGLICYTLWFALQLLISGKTILQNKNLRTFSIWLVALIMIQLIYGALMAGHKAATIAPTWPDINEEYLPDGLFKYEPLLINFVENKILIHFVHRNLAYLTLILVVVWFVKAVKIKTSVIFKRATYIPLVIVVVQVLLGVLTVLNSTKIVPNQWGSFEWLAQLHQLFGMFLLLSFIYVLYLSRPSTFKYSL